MALEGRAALPQQPAQREDDLAQTLPPSLRLTGLLHRQEAGRHREERTTGSQLLQ
jgi:hypothetical protein